MVVLVKGYRVVPQSLGGGTGFRHVHLKEHRGVFKATRSSEGGDSGEAVVAKGRTLFVGNVDDQGARPCIASSVSGFPNAPTYGYTLPGIIRVLVGASEELTTPAAPPCSEYGCLACTSRVTLLWCFCVDMCA